MRRFRVTSPLAALLLCTCQPDGFGTASLAASGLQPATLTAFTRYVAAAERLLDRDLSAREFLSTSGRGADHERILEDVQRGRLWIERLEVKDGGRPFTIPGGLVHHWSGMVFARGATLDEAVALLQDYDRAAVVYSPAIAQSRLLSRTGDRFSVSLRFVMTKVITVVLDTEHDARFFRPAPDRAYSRIVSTNIREVAEAGTARERVKAQEEEGGYLWRLHTYWRFLERDGGVYVQCVSISATRGIPAGLAWLVRPFVTSIPRESLTFTLERTRDWLARPAP